MALEISMEEHLRDITKKYAFYVRNVRDIIAKKGITPEDLRACLLYLSATNDAYKGEKITLMADKEAELEKRKTITEIFNFLSTKCTSFKYLRTYLSTLKFMKTMRD